MFKKTKSRNRLTRILALFCCLSMFVSVFAFFTDRVTQNTFGQAGNIDLLFTDLSSSKTGENGIKSTNEFAIDQSWKNTSLVSTNAIINPGDYFDLSYNLSNLGSKSMDVRQQLTVSSSVPMTDIEEYKLTITGKNNDTTIVTGKPSGDKLSIVYDLSDIILNGSVETEEDISWNEETYTARLDFDLMAGNDFMNSCVTVDYKAQAKQHRNTTDADWVEWINLETEVEEILTYPMLAASDTWYTSSTKRSTLTAINVVDTADEETISTASESWPAAVDWDEDGTNDDDVMCYINGTTLTIAGDGSGSILMNYDSSWAFSDHNKKDYFRKVETFSNASLLDTSKVNNMENLFYYASSIKSIDIGEWNTANVTNMSYMFASSSTSYPMSFGSLDVGNWDMSNVTKMKAMFQLCSSLTSLDVSNWDTSNVSDMSYVFTRCQKLTSLDVSKWDTRKATTMLGLFQQCNDLSVVDISNFDTSNTTDIGFMFYGCSSLGTIDVSHFETSKVTSFDHMFAHSNMKNIDTTSWDTSSATNMYGMFHSIKDTVIDVSNFDTSNVIVFGEMFEQCTKLVEIIGLEKFDTSKGVGFRDMFNKCYKLKELDLSSFDTSKATFGVKISVNGEYSDSTHWMFNECRSLEKITLGPKFTFVGDGTTKTNVPTAVLPTPNSSYIEGANGYWYNEAGTIAYAPADVPNNTADTYYAIPRGDAEIFNPPVEEPEDASLFQEVEYIEATGTQYIDTGFVPNQDTRVVADFQFTNKNNTFLFGSRASTSSKGYTVNISNGNFVTAYANSGNKTFATVDTNRHIIDKDKNQVYLDENLVLTQTYTSFTCPGPLQIFACYNNGASGYLPSSAKIYSFKIYDNDVLVRDFMPCYRISTGEVGLYDTVTGYFYPNAGTGTFLKGNNL